MDWDDIAATWDERDDVRAYAAAAFESLLRECDRLGFELDGSRACDFGCGTGLLSELLARRCRQVIAVDRSAKMIETVQDKVARLALDRIVPMAAELTPAVIEGDPSFREPFELITCSSVLGFVDDLAATVQMLADCLAPAGLFVQWDWELDPNQDETWGLSREHMRGALSSAGLEVLFLDVGFSITPGGETMSPLMAVARR